MKDQRKQRLILIAGDLLVVVLVTLAGFASHDSLSSASGRVWTTFLPVLLTWFLVGGSLGVFDLEKAAAPRELWRPFWALVAGGPFAAWGRSVMLGWKPISPIFVVVLGGIAALSILAWRAFYVFVVFPRWLKAGR